MILNLNQVKSKQVHTGEWRKTVVKAADTRLSSQQQQEEIKADETELREVVPVTSMAVEGFGKQKLLC